MTKKEDEALLIFERKIIKEYTGQKKKMENGKAGQI